MLQNQLGPAEHLTVNAHLQHLEDIKRETISTKLSKRLRMNKLGIPQLYKMSYNSLLKVMDTAKSIFTKPAPEPEFDCEQSVSPCA